MKAFDLTKTPLEPFPQQHLALFQDSADESFWLDQDTTGNFSTTTPCTFSRLCRWKLLTRPRHHWKLFHNNTLHFFKALQMKAFDLTKTPLETFPKQHLVLFQDSADESFWLDPDTTGYFSTTTPCTFSRLCRWKLLTWPRQHWKLFHNNTLHFFKALQMKALNLTKTPLETFPQQHLALFQGSANESFWLDQDTTGDFSTTTPCTFSKLCRWKLLTWPRHHWKLFHNNTLHFFKTLQMKAFDLTKTPLETFPQQHLALFQASADESFRLDQDTTGNFSTTTPCTFSSLCRWKL